MDVPQAPSVGQYNPLRWIPEFLELGRRRLRWQAPLQLDDRLDRAQELFVENDLLALPVVDNLAERRVVGIVRRSDIAGAYLRRVHGESNRSQ